MVQLVYTTKCGACNIRSLPDDKVAVLAAVEKLRKRGIEATILRDRVEIGQIWKLDGRWVYSYDF